MWLPLGEVCFVLRKLMHGRCGWEGFDNLLFTSKETAVESLLLSVVAYPLERALRWPKAA